MQDIFFLQFSCYMKNSWKRFLDDCFTFGLNHYKIYKIFKTYLSAYMATYIHNGNQRKLVAIFWYLNSKRRKNKWWIINLYYEKTDSHHYFVFNLCNQSHTKQNFQLNVARRIFIIVMDGEYRNTKCTELQVFFLSRQNYQLQ